MKISVAVLGLFVALFLSLQPPTTAFFFAPASTFFCRFVPDFFLCKGNASSASQGNGSSGSTGSTASSGANATAPAASGNATNASR
ncbi:uncharacterized protein LOC108047639 [Drosophila rhopaloa]|uniref:Uncharacterized protein LOC108047639 n=1 Tax=Drosophila rhopaloa TaxID=1041015 RepID=A0A6P4EZ52_DRORH|nr:uncharacterized protein LOC108047639 [Drosophila rhopaloa]